MAVNIDTKSKHEFEINPAGGKENIIQLTVSPESVSLRKVSQKEKIVIAPGDGRIFYVGSLDQSKLRKKYNL